ncbi:MAG TPA: hypothetical protein VJC03_05370, partial [bacterium]|nr:hypothetical protein [bacterium]
YIADGHHRFAVARRLFMENPRWKRVYVFAASLEGETINPTHLVISSKYWPLIENLFVWGAFPSFDVSLVRDGMIVRGRVKRKGELAVDLIDKMKKKLSPEEIFYTHRREEVPVRAVKGKLGLLLPPLDKKIFVRRVESGRVFPQKTTYFFPKIPSGILIHPLE